MEKKQIVFLYSELASYFLACIEELLNREDVDVYIVRWSVNKEAPFDFYFHSNLKVYNRNDFSFDKLEKLVAEINPSLIYCSGWMDNDYLKICKKYKKNIPVVVGFDNQWKATIKQWIATVVSPFRILNHFTHCWVPGDLQYNYATKLGFKKQNILTGFYSCDFNFFHNLYQKNKETKKVSFPKKFIYVGRYYEFKGIKNLWKAFIELQNETPNEWELWCLGTGDIEPIKHPKIKHFGFVQPKDMPEFIRQTGIFVLPSHFEPWGVVVHEFAASGFPIICSDEVGARTAFVENNKNGYIYKSGDVEQLKSIMKTVMNKSKEELFSMAEHSVDKANQLTPEKWVTTLLSILK